MVPVAFWGAAGRAPPSENQYSFQCIQETTEAVSILPREPRQSWHELPAGSQEQKEYIFLFSFTKRKIHLARLLLLSGFLAGVPNFYPLPYI